MICWIRGKDLLAPPFNLTKCEILKAVQKGDFVPFMSPDGEWIKENEFLEPDGERVWRVFPNDKLYRKYEDLISLQYRLELAQTWSQKSDEWHIEAFKHDKNLDWVDDPPPSLRIDLETYINEKLPKERQIYSQIIQDFPAQIEKLEKELAPDLVWKDLELGPVQQEIIIDRILHAFYVQAHIEFALLTPSEKQEIQVERIEREKTSFKDHILQVGSPALKEISEVYQIAIKGVGISSKKAEKYSDLPQEYRTRALEYYDKQPDKFKYIKREFLEERGLYGFSQGKEWRDFKSRLIKKAIKDQLGLELGGQALLEIIQKEKTD
jgi:hypothetical protein